jgi:hypothetical protein
LASRAYFINLIPKENTMPTEKTYYMLLTGAAVALILSAAVGTASARGYTSPTGPRGHSFTTSSTAHYVKGGATGTSTITGSGGKWATGTGTVLKSPNGSYNATGSASNSAGGTASGRGYYDPATGAHNTSGTATNRNGQTVTESGSGTGQSGSVTLTGANGSKTYNY